MKKIPIILLLIIAIECCNIIVSAESEVQIDCMYASTISIAKAGGGTVGSLELSTLAKAVENKQDDNAVFFDISSGLSGQDFIEMDLYYVSKVKKLIFQGETYQALKTAKITYLDENTGTWETAVENVDVASTVSCEVRELDFDSELITARIRVYFLECTNHTELRLYALYPLGSVTTGKMNNNLLYNSKVYWNGLQKQYGSIDGNFQYDGATCPMLMESGKNGILEYVFEKEQILDYIEITHNFKTQGIKSGYIERRRSDGAYEKICDIETEQFFACAHNGLKSFTGSVGQFMREEIIFVNPVATRAIRIVVTEAENGENGYVSFNQVIARLTTKVSLDLKATDNIEKNNQGYNVTTKLVENSGVNYSVDIFYGGFTETGKLVEISSQKIELESLSETTVETKLLDTDNAISYIKGFVWKNESMYPMISQVLEKREFSDNGQLLRNPDMGLFSYYYDNDPNNYDVAYGADELFDDVPEASIVFMRFAWAFLEPKNGEYDFSMIDSVINRYSETGRQVAFRITTAETGFPYATPSWVYDAGCQYYRWDSSGLNPNGEYLMADFNNPEYLKYQRRFTEELAKRYDGNPNVAFVEVGNLGVWGEGHTSMSTVKYTLDTAKECLDMYVDNFHETYLHINNLTQGYSQLEDYAIEQGVGWRNDSFYVNASQLDAYSDQIEKYWRGNTIAMEPQHWANKTDWDADECINAFATNHPTFFGLHGFLGNIMETDSDFVRKAARRIGYRFVPESVEMPGAVKAHGILELNIKWKNNGCAPSYKPYYSAITLKNKNGSVETVMTDDSFSMSDIMPDSNRIQNLSLRINDFVPAGEYNAYLSVGALDGTPKIELPIDGDDGCKRYFVGKISVTGDYEIQAGQVQNANKLSIKFKPADDIFGEFAVTDVGLYIYEYGKRISKNSDETISLNEFSEQIQHAISAKVPISFETPEISKNNFVSGVEYKVGMWIDNYCLSDSITKHLVGKNNQFTTIGTIVFDDLGKMKFRAE